VIKDKLFINLDEFVDLKEFDALLPSICRGMATANHLALYGLQIYHPGTVHPDAQGIEIEPLSQVYNYWNNLPEDDPLKIAGKDLTYNQLTTFLKFALGGYDHYMVYKLLETGFERKGVGEIINHFPDLMEWIYNLKNSGIFKRISSANIMALDAGGIPWEHHDPEDPLTGIFDPNDKNPSGYITEFVHIKTDCDRPFYMIHPKTKEKIYINTRVAWWDERDWHGGEPINRPTYTVRVNGLFTDDFRKRLGVEDYDVKL
jgi:hypothetical protein